MRGRFTPSPELDQVAEWIGSEFQAMGLEPAGDEGSYIQRFPLPNGEPGTAPNVVAILPGSDSLLRDEYVVYTAHMDHVGVRASGEGGDSIFNGADDDASGTATVMEVAEAMASLDPAPRRSILFVLVSGEERGLWGSDWFAANPPVPTTAMVANLNADMVGRNWTDTIVAIGREHSSLGRTLEEVNRAHPELGMTAVEDLWPEERFYFRSDHFNFARRGVPVLFFFNGTHEDYHRPSDEVAKIDGDKTARIGRLLFYLGLAVADADERPTWDPDSYRRIVEADDQG
ncbi:MAG: M20/M25/M40 family metallo-hydrolase [Gemmatimonadota bacterium]